MKKETKIYLTIVVIVILIVVGILWLKSRPTINDEIAKCIAGKSKAIISKTCTACARQEEILGENFKYFDIIDITEHPEVVEQYKIEGVPTWIINGEKYTGVKTIEELRELTGC